MDEYDIAFFPMSPGSVCNKSSEFRLNHGSLGSDLHEAARREDSGALLEHCRSMLLVLYSLDAKKSFDLVIWGT